MRGRSVRSRRISVVALATLGWVMQGCGTEVSAPPEGSVYEANFSELRRLPPSQGTYRLWVFSRSDTVAVATLAGGDAGHVSPVTFEMPLEGAVGAMVSVEPPGDSNPLPSLTRVLRGQFEGREVQLAIEGAVTDGRPLQPEPGAHSLFTTSNNSLGYPSAENAGLWLFTLTPSRNAHGTREVKVTPLEPGWTYEGWVVRQGDPEVWISYGKFRPDEVSLLTSRDDTGVGPFAGVQDFRNGGVEDVPGEEWVTLEIAGPLGIGLPGGLEVPLELDALDGQGRALWHHVITVEPAWNLVEGPVEGEPFPLSVYENEIGAGGPGVPRPILPTGEIPSGVIRPQRP